MDVCCQGGYALGRRLFAEIARQELRFAFHSWGTALEVVAAAHLGICWPETVVEWLEYPCYSSPGRAGMYPFPLAAEILKDPLADRQRRSDRPARAGARRDGRRIGDRTLSVDSGSVVVLPHRLAGGNAGGDVGPQHPLGQVGKGREAERAAAEPQEYNRARVIGTAAKSRGATSILPARQNSQPASRGSRKPPKLWTGSMHFLLISGSPLSEGSTAIEAVSTVTIHPLRSVVKMEIYISSSQRG